MRPPITAQAVFLREFTRLVNVGNEERVLVFRLDGSDYVRAQEVEIPEREIDVNIDGRWARFPKDADEGSRHTIDIDGWWANNNGIRKWRTS